MAKTRHTTTTKRRQAADADARKLAEQRRDLARAVGYQRRISQLASTLARLVGVNETNLLDLAHVIAARSGNVLVNAVGFEQVTASAERGARRNVELEDIVAALTTKVDTLLGELATLQLELDKRDAAPTAHEARSV